MRKLSLVCLLMVLFTFVVACNAMAGLKEDLIAYEPALDADLTSYGVDVNKTEFLIQNRQPGLIEALNDPKAMPAEVNVGLQPVELARVNFRMDSYSKPLLVKFYKDPDPTTIGVKITLNDVKEVQFYERETVPQMAQKISDAVEELIDALPLPWWVKLIIKIIIIILENLISA